MTTGDLIAFLARPYAPKHIQAGFSWQIQVQYDEVGPTSIAAVERFNKLCRALTVSDQNQFASNSIFLKGFAHEVDVGRVVFDQ